MGSTVAYLLLLSTSLCGINHMQSRVEPLHENKAKGPAPNSCPCQFWVAETTYCQEAGNDSSFLGSSHDLTLKVVCGNQSCKFKFCPKVHEKTG